MKELLCLLGHHDWKTNKWQPVYDQQGIITGFYYKECGKLGCFAAKCVFNYDKLPDEKQ